VGVRFASYFALATGVGLVATWVAAWAGVIPADLAPRQLAASHVAAELATAALLVSGAVLTLRTGRAHWILAAGLGALAYATLNVMSDFTDVPAMLAVLALTLVLTFAALVAAFKGSDIGGRGGRDT
jgi:hypothetical protein